MSRAQKNRRRELAQTRALETTVEKTPVQISQELSGYSYLAHTLLGPRYKTILGAGLAAAITLVAITPAISPGTSYREIGRDLASIFQSNEPNYDALWERGEQDLFGRPAQTNEEMNEVLRYVQSGKVNLRSENQYELREETITNYKSNLKERIDKKLYITAEPKKECFLTN